MDNYYIAFHFITCILMLVHVRYESGILGEGWGKYILPVMIFSWVFYIFWLIIWPGSLRLMLKGKRVEDTHMARAVQRYRRAH